MKINNNEERYQNEKEEKNKSWWQSVKDAFNRGKAEGNGGVKGFFKGCWYATETGWSKAPTWAKVGVGAGLIAGSALCMPLHTFTFVNGSGPGIFTGTSFSLGTIPHLLSHPSVWVTNPGPLAMIGAGTLLGTSGALEGLKKVVDKIKTTSKDNKNEGISQINTLQNDSKNKNNQINNMENDKKKEDNINKEQETIISNENDLYDDIKKKRN